MPLIKQSLLAFCGNGLQLLVQSGFGWYWNVAGTGRNRVCSEAHAACLAAGVSGPHRFR